MSRRMITNPILDYHYMFTHGKKSKAFLSDVFFNESDKQAYRPDINCHGYLEFFGPDIVNMIVFELVDIRCVRYSELTTGDMMALGVWEEDGAWYNGVKDDDPRYMKRTAYNSLSAAFAEMINAIGKNMWVVGDGYVYIGTFKQIQPNERKEANHDIGK